MSSLTFSPTGVCGGVSLLVAVMCVASGISLSRAAEMDDVRKQLLSGKYTDAADIAGAAENTQPEIEDWPLLRAEALMSSGKYRNETLLTN